MPVGCEKNMKEKSKIIFDLDAIKAIGKLETFRKFCNKYNLFAYSTIVNPDKKIEITVEGGLVQAVEGIPADVEVWVNDYDVDGAEEDRLFTDANGDQCNRFQW